MNYIIYDEGVNNDVHSISKSLTDIITSPYDQHATLIIKGNLGSGKSAVGLKIAYETAKKVAKHFNNGFDIPNGGWKKYFTLNQVAIMFLDKVIDLLENVEEYHIYGLDDIGVGYAAREFRTDKNQRMNKIFETMRTDKTVTYVTIPDAFLLDKVPRELISKAIETSQDGNYYKYNLNIVKYFNIEKLARESKILHVNPLIEYATENRQYVRYKIPKPPEELFKEYRRSRHEAAKRLRIEEAQSIRKSEHKGEIKKEKENEQKDIDKVIVYDIKTRIENGNELLYQVCAEHGWDKEKYYRSLKLLKEGVQSDI